MAIDRVDLDEGQRARLVAAAKALDSEVPPPNPLTGPPVLTFEELRVAYTEHVLLWSDTKAEAAAVLGVNPSTLYRRTQRATDGGPPYGPAGDN